MSTNTKQTPQTAKAVRRVFQILEDNFDCERGQFLQGYDDDRVAEETGISVNAVKEYRTNAFGKLSPPDDLTKAKIDLDNLETAFLKIEGEFKGQIKELRQAVLKLQRKFD